MEKNTSQILQDEGRIGQSNPNKRKKRRKRKVLAQDASDAPLRIVNIAHDKCDFSRFDYVILPIGYKYNDELRTLKKGDIIRFLDGSEHWVDSVVRVQIKSAIIESLCKTRYGFGIKRALEIWKSRVEVRGLDSRIVSENECLVVFYYLEKVQYGKKN